MTNFLNSHRIHHNLTAALPLRWRLAASLVPPGGTHISGNFPEFPHQQLHPTPTFLIEIRFTT